MWRWSGWLLGRRRDLGAVTTVLVGVVMVLVAIVALVVLNPRSGAPDPVDAAPPGGDTGEVVDVDRGATGTPAAAPACPGATNAARECPGAPPSKPDSGKRWSVAFREEFTGTSYDHSKLTPCFDWNYGDCTASFNHGRERYLPSQVVVSGGTAKLVAAPLSPPYYIDSCVDGQCTYKSGLLSTARPRADDGSDYLYKFTYGYVETRIKFPATRGFLTAFWLLPADPTYAYRSELDVLEQLGDDPTTMYMTYHYDNRSREYHINKSKFHNGTCPVKDYSRGFVRVGVDWRPDRIDWYIDGVKCATFSDARYVEDGPMQMVLQLSVDHSWVRRWNVGLTDHTLVRQLEVDYIRVYQQVAV